jgi:ribonucleotide monophosphatase NagD (HAD superfamily)
VVLVATVANPRASIERLQTALRLLLRGARLIGMGDDRAYPTPRGMQIGAGAVTRMLAYAANVTPVFCGKPEAWFFLDLCKRMGVEPWRCVLIGDNLEADIAGARGVGMKSILTLTGLSTRLHAESAAPEQQADWVIGTLKELLFR